MTLTKLELKNFKSYYRKEFEFSYGLTGIIGKNGAGKSTIFEAIIFALYGESRQSKESLKNAKAEPKEELLVTLYFTLGDKEYKVERALKGKSMTAKAELYCANEHIATSVKGVNATIVKMLGMSKEAFVNTVFASQKELTALSQLKSDERKKIIRKLLGLERVDLIEKSITLEVRDLNREIKISKEHLLDSETISQIKQSIKDEQRQLLELNKEKKSLKKALDDAVKRVTDFDKRVESIVKLKEEYKQLERLIAVSSAKEVQFTKELTTLHRDLQKRQESEKYYRENRAVLAEYEQQKSNIARLQKTKEAYLRKEGLLKEQVQLRIQLKQVKGEIKELQELLKGVGSLKEKREEYSDASQQYRAWLNEIEKRVKEAQEQKTKAVTIIESSQKQLEGITHLGKEANCPTCTRPLLDEYESVVASLSKTIETLSQSQLQNATMEINQLRQKESEAQKKYEKLERALQKIDAELILAKNREEELQKRELLYSKITQSGLSNKAELEKLESLDYDKELHKTLLEEFGKTELLYRKLIGLKPLIDEIPLIQKRIESLEEQKAEELKSYVVFNEQLKGHKYSKKEEEQLSFEYKEAQSLKDSLNQKLQSSLVLEAEINGRVNGMTQKLDDESQKSKLLQTRVEQREDLEKLKAYLITFKSAINSQVTPRISQIASELFFEITNGRYQHIEVDEAFEFYIFDEGKRYPLERFSGGEVDLANLVLRIAISKTLNELSSNSSIGFLAFDEVFGSQDQQRRYAIMESFNKISQHYREIFLISHDPEIKELFERVIEL